MSNNDINEPVKTGFLKWEVDVEHGNTVFTFLAFTKRGTLRKAANFVIELAEKGQNNASNG
jgi:hypothetical protein